MRAMHLRMETAGAVATLTIDRPAKRNAMSLEMWSAIPGLLASVPDTARVLLIQGGDHFTADIIDAATALRIGLVNELHPAEALRDRAKELAETIGSRAQVSVRGAKTIIGMITDGLAEDASVHSLYSDAVHSADYAEGVR